MRLPAGKHERYFQSRKILQNSKHGAQGSSWHSLRLLGGNFAIRLNSVSFTCAENLVLKLGQTDCRVRQLSMKIEHWEESISSAHNETNIEK